LCFDVALSRRHLTLPIELVPRGWGVGVQKSSDAIRTKDPYERKELSALIKYWMVGIGGFLGSVLRFWVGSFIGGRFGVRFPYGTFVINVTGSFLVGMVVTALATKAHWNTNWRYLIPIGFIGGYTTFSTFEFETMRLVQNGQMLMATLNVTLSVGLGFIGVWAGMLAGRVIP
jgi:CrcB protein